MSITNTQEESVKIYLRDLYKNSHTIEKEEELYLFEQYALTKDKSIKDFIINANRRWVVTIAKKFMYNDKVMLSDLINEGNIGLIVAFDKFDYTKGVKFYQFATDYIKLNIRQYLNDVLVDVPQPANRYLIDSKIKKIKNNLKKAGHTSIPTEMLIEEYEKLRENDRRLPEVSNALYNDISNLKKGFVSSALSYNDDDDILENKFKSDKSFNTDYELSQTELKTNLVKNLKDLLKPNEYNIVVMSFGIGCEEMVPEQIGRKLGYTRERVGQILKNSLDILKRHKDVMKELI